MSSTPKQEKVNTKKVTTVGKKTSKTIKVNKDSSYKFKVRPYKLTKKTKRNILKPMQPKPNSEARQLK